MKPLLASWDISFGANKSDFAWVVQDSRRQLVVLRIRIYFCYSIISINRISSVYNVTGEAKITAEHLIWIVMFVHKS